MTRVSLRDIAQKVGVSTASVSLALRNKGNLSAERVEQIRRVAEEMGYRPSPLLSSLATKRFRARSTVDGMPLGLLCSHSPNPREKPAFRGNYLDNLRMFAGELGYSLADYTEDGSEDVGKLSRTLYNRGVQGLVLGPVFDPSTFEGLDWSNFSVIQCGRFQTTLPFHIVRPNIFQAVKLAFSKAEDRGYRRIGFAMGHHQPILEDDESRYGAAIALQREKLAEEDQIPIFWGSFEELNQLGPWVKEHKPDLVIGFHSGVMWAIRDAGYRVPEDIGFLSLHGAARDGVAGLEQNNRMIARQTIQQLDQMIRHNERGMPDAPLHILVDSTFVEGNTLRATDLKGSS